MKFLKIQSKISSRFPETGTFFALGKLEELLKTLRNREMKVVTMEQVHGSKSSLVKKFAKRPVSGDAVYTRTQGLYLAVRSADCLPILFYSPRARVIGAVHAGWKGSYKKVLTKTLLAAVKRFGTSPRDFYFYIGPGARPCCYDITNAPQRLKKFDKKYRAKIVRREKSKLFLDLPRSNILQLLELQVPQRHIEDSGECTIHQRTYPSHRRQEGKRAQTLLSGIVIK